MIDLWLECMVPLRILEIERAGGPTEREWEAAREFGSAVGEKGDLLLFGPAPGQSGLRAARHERGALLGRLAEVVACAAFLPGGITVFGLHFDAGTPDATGCVCCRALGRRSEGGTND